MRADEAQHERRIPPDPKSLIRDRALALGFDAVGFCRAELGEEARERLGAFLAAGHHGDMGWLATRAAARSHPRQLWRDARSVIALGMTYAPDDDPLATLALRDRGAISVYARNRDYHDVVKGMLKHLAQFVVARFGPAVKVFVDTAPVMEKPLAERAGIGWRASTPTWSRACTAPGCSWARSTPRSRSHPTNRTEIIAAPARVASPSARPMHSPHRIGSMRRGASRISPSNTTARSRTRCAR